MKTMILLPHTPPDYHCSFCGKDRDEVTRLVAGPHGVYICNECVDACRAILDEEGVPIAARLSSTAGQRLPRVSLFADKRFIAVCASRGITVEMHDGGFSITPPASLRTTPDALQVMLREIQQEIEKEPDDEDAQE